MDPIIQKKNYGAKIRNHVFILVLLLIAAGIYGFLQYQKLSVANNALEKGQAALSALESTKNNLATQYPVQRKQFYENFAGALKSLKDVYPTEENYTRLAITFDQLFKDLNRSDNQAFLSDLKFGQAQSDAEKDYAVLPINMTFSGTRNNFDAFLNFIENSGDLTDGNRLMDINSININFSDSSDQNAESRKQTLDPGKKIITASITLNAYFQAPVK